MTSTPGNTVFSPIVYENTSLEVKSIINAGPFNKSRFDKLFALVFANQKIQKLTTQVDYSNMLDTIANIAATK